MQRNRLQQLCCVGGEMGGLGRDLHGQQIRESLQQEPSLLQRYFSVPGEHDHYGAKEFAFSSSPTVLTIYLYAVDTQAISAKVSF